MSVRAKRKITPEDAKQALEFKCRRDWTNSEQSYAFLKKIVIFFIRRMILAGKQLKNEQKR